MTELKLCPFCGKPVRYAPSKTAHCTTCNIALLPEVWENRPIEDDLRRKLDKAIETLRSFAHEGNWDFHLRDGPIWIAPFDPNDAAIDALKELGEA